jgi:hypothetical protein
MITIPPNMILSRKYAAVWFDLTIIPRQCNGNREVTIYGKGRVTRVHLCLGLVRHLSIYHIINIIL